MCQGYIKCNNQMLSAYFLLDPSIANKVHIDRVREGNERLPYSQYIGKII